MNTPRLSMSIAMFVGLLAATVGAEAFIETVPVGNPGNAPDTRYETPGYGRVDYVYNIGRYEVTAGQYTEFLNAVAATDMHSLYSVFMQSGSHSCHIQRSGAPGSYTYSVAPDWENRPVNYVAWADAARFANWMHNGQPIGPQDLSTTENGSYFLNGVTYYPEVLAIAREPDATWVIPTEDEWYKAAYFKGGGTDVGYWAYPTQSDAAPRAESPPGTDTANGSANYFSGVFVDPTFHMTEVGAYNTKPSDSTCGTFDQGGNMAEWNETVLYGWGHGVRGGAYDTGVVTLHSSVRGYSYSTNEYSNIGFRLAYIPEPSSTVLIALASVAALGRRRYRVCRLQS